MSNKLQSVSFHNQKISVLHHDNKPYIEMRSIVENIGLDWGAQLKRIKRNNILNSTMVIMTTVAKDGKNREIICLPLGYLNGWLFGIDTNRVKPEIKGKLEQYQLECFDVLYNHFMPKMAQYFPNTISAEQQQRIKKAVNERSFRTGEHYQKIYVKLYDHFKIPKYQDLPSSKFNDAIMFLSDKTRYINQDDVITVNKTNLNSLVFNMIWLNKFYQDNKLYQVFKMLGSDFGFKMEDHFQSGSFVAGMFKKDIEAMERF